MDILDRIHKNMYGLHVLNEVTQFIQVDKPEKDENGNPIIVEPREDKPNDRFDKLYNKIVLLYPDEKNLYQDFYNKLFEYLKQDQFNKFPILFFNKKEYPKLIDIIHKLDNVIAQINRLKGVKININPNIKNIPKVYENKEMGITVYRADNIFQSIELGKGANFCISVGLNGYNHYYNYKYDYDGKQKATMYFVHSSNQEDPNKILAIDIKSNGGFIYTNTDNGDKWFTSYDNMINSDHTSPDLMVIPKEVFKWVDQPINTLSQVELNEVIKINSFAIQYIENPSEELQLATVNRDGGAIEYIQNPSEQVQLAAVNKNGMAIQYIKNPSEQVQLAAVNKNGMAIQYIKNPSEQVQLAAVNTNGNVIRHIKNPSEQVQLAAVKGNGYVIRHIKNPSEQVQLAAIERFGDAIRYIKNPSEQLQLVAVNSNGRAIEYIKNPSEAMQLVAVKQNDSVIEHIKTPSEAVQLVAVKKDGHNIKYIQNPSEAVQLAAVNQNGYAIIYIKNPSEQLQLVAVNSNGRTIEYIKNPSEQVQLAAVTQDADSIRHIKNPSEKTKLAAVKKKVMH